MTDPIILLGAARSGTKYLRDILAAADGVVAVPYDINYVWRYGVADYPDDVLRPDMLTDKSRKFIRKTILQMAKARAGDVVIEKTVANPLRIPFVDAAFPKARYVHLVRDGRDVAESAMRMWEAPPDWCALWAKLRGMPLSNAPYVFWFARNFVSGIGSGRKGGKVWGPRFKGIDDMVMADNKASLAEICATQWAATVTQARIDLAAIPSERVFEIRYEDLIAGDDALSALIAALDLPDQDAIRRAHCDKLRPSTPSQWKNLPAADQTAFQNIIGPVLVQEGYL